MTPLLLLLAALSSETVVAVGLDGSAPVADRTRAHGLLVEALRGVEGLSVVAIADPAAMLGEDVGKIIASCGADDRCRAAALGAVARGPVVLGTLDSQPAVEGVARARLDLRVATATAGATVRLSRDLSGPLEPALRAVLIEAMSTLFPGRAVRPTAKLTVVVDVAGAAITIDGAPVGTTPLPVLDVALGSRRVVASLPDGRTAETTAELVLGGAATVELSLRAEHTALPWILAGGAVALAGGGAILGAVAEGTASDWATACPSQVSCAAGYTRARYDADADAVALQGGLATGLLVGAGVALVSAAVVWFIEGGP